MEKERGGEKIRRSSRTDAAPGKILIQFLQGLSSGGRKRSSLAQNLPDSLPVFGVPESVPSSVNHRAVFGVEHKVQQGVKTRIVQGMSVSESVLQGGKPHVPKGGKALLRLSPDSRNAVFQVEPFSMGKGAWRKGFPKRCQFRLYHTLDAGASERADMRCGEGLFFRQALPRSVKEKRKDEDKPLVGVDVSGSSEHLFFHPDSPGPEVGKGLGGRKPPEAFPALFTPEGSQGHGAFDEGAVVHILVCSGS
jgi:hypothetical protein